MFDARRVTATDYDAIPRAIRELADTAYLVSLVRGERRAPLHVGGMGAIGDRLRRVAAELGRRQTLVGGPGVRVTEREDGRQIEVEDRKATDDGGDMLYDVVTIGGWYDSAGTYPTVNSVYGEKNHVLSAGLTEREVNTGSWSWGAGDTQTHFAIAAIPHGTDTGLWPNSNDPIWWNIYAPLHDIKARSIGENMGGPVAVGLTIGVIGG